MTKTELMNKLVKKAAGVTDPVRSIVNKELRHVSASTTLNELNRVLNRNRFVLVEQKYMVTTTDLLMVLGEPPMPGTPTKPETRVDQKQSEEGRDYFSTPKTAASTPGGNSEDDGAIEDEKNAMGLKLAAAALGGMGVAATAAYVMMRGQQN